MARITNGVLGGFSGTLGSVVGCRWKEVDYIRSRPRITKRRKPTQAQLEARARFTFLNTWLKKISPFVAMGFKDYSGSMTGLQAATSCNAKAVTGTYPSFNLDFQSFKVSHGLLPPVNGARVISVEKGTLEYSWSPGNDSKGMQWNDQVMLLALIPENGQVWGVTAGPTRDIGFEKVVVDQLNSGMVAETYIAFVSEDRKKISDSLYLGSVIIA